MKILGKIIVTVLNIVAIPFIGIVLGIIYAMIEISDIWTEKNRKNIWRNT